MRRVAWSPLVRPALAVTLLAALVLLPSRTGALSVAHFARLPLEVPAIVLLLCSLPRRVGRVAVLLLVVALGVLTLWRLADMGMVLAFRREFNPVLDVHLVASGIELASGALGRPAAWAAILGAVAALAGLVALAGWALGGIVALGRRGRTRLGGTAALVLAVGAAVALLRPAAPVGLPASAEIVRRAERLGDAIADEARFAAALGRDVLDETPDFAALAGRDVIVLFVESYGRSWLEAPEYRETGRARLEAVQDRLRGAGFAARSGWIDSPTRGGQSWLAHGAMMSGLWTTSQSRYDAVMASGRVSLNRLFAQAGWRTAAVVPAITRDWPEARWFGYDAVHDAASLGYAGVPFGWVTMPDQYTLSAMDRLVLDGPGPVMVEAALITSHAPWTPLPAIVPWDAIGDGAIFDGTHRAGGTPREVWSSPETIRAAYSRSLDHVLEVVAQWIARAAGDALVVVVGDHQPAPLVTGEDASAQVPMHVIARDSALLALLPGPLSEGMIPEADLPGRRMDRIRALFARCFSTGGCGAREES